ncbi:SDR family NAD(P)-dependent oxidoreductase [Zavarzinia compransoris]|uniref:Acetoin dehydrogenase n=1 Tax=Zavarzinia compransoris TaxID=1264899 RepID=A0A317E1N4_9PROT|nr:SDR family NAD(P)-dependent oxidoreductase [Zavarzinia compransoris]PWR20859.1 acetoin dehydrogenase [Zavarzinia compransoris]TDP44305.1 short-subunit dehydrogenase [Zavarzinia compransoris]
MAQDAFTGKVAVVTGAASGIGQALARDFARRGAKLAISDVNLDRLNALAAELRQAGATVMADRLDVADRDALFAYADKVAAEWGGADIVINNAGVALVGSIASLPVEQIEWLMGINFWGVVHGTKAFLPQLAAKRAGSIVNVSSVFGLIGVPGQGAYCAAKFAVRGFTETLRQEMHGTGVHIACVHPGGIKTNIANAARVIELPAGADSAEAVARRFEEVVRTTPEQAAATIIRGIEKRAPRILIGADAHVISGLARLLPVAYATLVRKAFGGLARGAKNKNNANTAAARS